MNSCNIFKYKDTHSNANKVSSSKKSVLFRICGRKRNILYSYNVSSEVVNELSFFAINSLFSVELPSVLDSFKLFQIKWIIHMSLFMLYSEWTPH